ncbi:MAG TPA: RICIN domain-containing protein [Ktedonobacteraceae bacterium]|nr:RICIN domain-containing protein [Ktedonobacteraceae bacterium]
MRRFTYRVGLPVLLSCLLVSMFALTFFSTSRAHAAGETVAVWLTTPDQTKLLAQQGNLTFSSSIGSNSTTITVNDGTAYQQMVGFGASITDSSAWLMYNKLSSAQRSALMNQLFSTSSGIGLAFLRQPIGSSDLSLNEYTYDDLSSGTDPNLTHFSISHDTAYIIPILQQALGINSNIKIMATPWSPPAWMKSNNSLNSGGTLLTSDYGVYAQYLVNFIKAYQANGVPIYAITPQNEPLNTNNMPTLSMSASQEATFIANNLGPAFASNGLSTQILAYDHNWDNTSYAATVLSSSAAAYVAGTAYHCYAGDASGQTTTHNAYPGKDIYMTECSGGTWENNSNPTWSATFKDVMELLINSTRNWARSVVRWGMALDTSNGPYVNTPAACSTCRGIVTINQSTGAVTYNSDYYGLGQASKFVQQGAYRIDSNSFGSGNIEDVAFKNPDGSKVLVVYNGGSGSTTFQVKWNNEAFSYTLPAGAAVTFKWSGSASTPTPTPTSAATPTPTPTGGIGGGQYYIQNRYSGLVLDDTNWSTSNGTLIQQWSLVSGQADQQWSFVATGDGYYYIKNNYSGLVLDDKDWSTSNGTQIQQWSLVNGQANQEWSLVATGDGYYYIQNRYSGLVLDDTNWSTSNGTIIQQWSLVSGQADQEWKLIAA